MKVIYDVGSNNGDDIPYYLLKADLVVAVEAVPGLADSIRRRFPTEIATGRLVVENFVVTVLEQAGTVPFYRHRGHHVLSQFGRPPEAQMEQFEELQLQSRRLVDIIREHGTPLYVKIDVEGYDQHLLADMFKHRIYPPYLSAESHSIEVFSTLVSLGKYDSFKIVDGPTVPKEYERHSVRTAAGPVEYSFPDHSAGPFGNDIKGGWQRANSFLRTLAHVGLGWKDIHVSAVDPPDA